VTVLLCADGIVICLENGCKLVKMALSASSNLKDGGIAAGFGSLSAYRVLLLCYPFTSCFQRFLSQAHIVHHPTHALERHARVKAEEQAGNDLTNNVRISIYLGSFLTFAFLNRYQSWIRTRLSRNQLNDQTFLISWMLS
jgi:hypothetical protein